jgi:hypothetical protein
MDAPQEPRWLDAEERQAWLALASTLNRLPAALDANGPPLLDFLPKD